MSDQRADSIRVMCPLFHAGEGGSTPTSALQLRFGATGLATAKALNRLWHSRLPHCGKPACRVAYAASFGGLYYAAAIWTNPLARLLPQFDWLELNRLAIAPDAPKNTASRMLAWMARDIRTRFPEVSRLISYQDCEVHSGTIYQAAGWLPVQESSGGEWSRPSRWVRKTQSASPKRRWEKVLRPDVIQEAQVSLGAPQAGLFDS